MDNPLFQLFPRIIGFTLSFINICHLIAPTADHLHIALCMLGVAKDGHKLLQNQVEVAYLADTMLEKPT